MVLSLRPSCRRARPGAQGDAAAGARRHPRLRSFSETPRKAVMVCTRSPLRPASCSCCWFLAQVPRTFLAGVSRRRAAPLSSVSGSCLVLPAQVPRTFLAGDSRRRTAPLSSVSGSCRYVVCLSRGRTALAIFHSFQGCFSLFSAWFYSPPFVRRALRSCFFSCSFFLQVAFAFRIFSNRCPTLTPVRGRTPRRPPAVGCTTS